MRAGDCCHGQHAGIRPGEPSGGAQTPTGSRCPPRPQRRGRGRAGGGRLLLGRAGGRRPSAGRLQHAPTGRGAVGSPERRRGEEENGGRRGEGGLGAVASWAGLRLRQRSAWRQPRSGTDRRQRPGGGFGGTGWAPLRGPRLAHCPEPPGAGAVPAGPRGRAAQAGAGSVSSAFQKVPRALSD